MGLGFGRGYQFGVALCENQRNKIKALLNFLLNGILKAPKQQRAEENRGKTNKQMEGRRLPFHLRPHPSFNTLRHLLGSHRKVHEECYEMPTSSKSFDMC